MKRWLTYHISRQFFSLFQNLWFFNVKLSFCSLLCLVLLIWDPLQVKILKTLLVFIQFLSNFMMHTLWWNLEFFLTNNDHMRGWKFKKHYCWKLLDSTWLLFCKKLPTFWSYRPFWDKCTKWPQNDLEQYNGVLLTLTSKCQSISLYMTSRFQVTGHLET